MGRLAPKGDDPGMDMRWSGRSLLGLPAVDADGESIGRVVDTYPFDGGGLELVVVRLPRFGERRMLPAGAVSVRGGVLFARFTRAQVEDSPALSVGRHAAEDADRAVWHWRFEEPAAFTIARPARLPSPWRHNSGSSGTERQFRTTPSPTMPSAS
jgi:PRC-barrel domain